MRYYGNDYLQELVREITAARDCVSYQNYALPVERTEVDLGQERQKHNGLVAARDAYTHISDIKDKYSLLIEVLTTYYRSVDEVSSNIVLMTERINSMLDHANESLVRICNILEGVGDYQGSSVTDQNIHSARINQQKLCSNRDEFILLAIDAEIEGDCLSLTTIQLYMDYVRRMNFTSDMLSPEDITRLTSAYEFYVKLRFGDFGIMNLDMQHVYNCIEAYELINPSAKETIDSFFAEAYEENDDTINVNIARIKYAIYTADSRYRDMILYYMPKLQLGGYDGSWADDSRPQYSGISIFPSSNNALYVNLKAENFSDFGQFFHEFGHGIDDVSCLAGCTSDGMRDILVEDLSEYMMTILGEASSSTVTCEDKDLIATLSEEEKQEVIDFVIGPVNINIFYSREDNSEYPPEEVAYLPWASEVDDHLEDNRAMTAAYHYIKKYFGSVEYGPSEDGSCQRNVNLTSLYGTCSVNSLLVMNDIVGGLTNNTAGGSKGHSAYDYHYLDDNSYFDVSDVQRDLSRFHYWYDVSGNLTENVSTEFFAEMFDCSVRLKDEELDPTRMVFGSACSTYNNLFTQLYDEIQ